MAPPDRRLSGVAMDAAESLCRVVDAAYEKRFVTSSSVLATPCRQSSDRRGVCTESVNSLRLTQASQAEESELVNEASDGQPPLLGRQSCCHNGQFRWYRGRTQWPSTAVPADLEITAAAAARR